MLKNADRNEVFERRILLLEVYISELFSPKIIFIEELNNHQLKLVGSRRARGLKVHPYRARRLKSTYQNK